MLSGLLLAYHMVHTVQMKTSPEAAHIIYITGFHSKQCLTLLLSIHTTPILLTPFAYM